jgi:hypothetical protein
VAGEVVAGAAPIVGEAKVEAVAEAVAAPVAEEAVAGVLVGV